MAYTTMESGLAERLFCKQETPCAKKESSHTRLDFLCTGHSYTAEGLEFLDTPLHIHVHVVTIHECKVIMMVLIVSVREIMV